MASIAPRTLLVLLFLASGVTEALAQASWAVAERDDEQILKLVDNLKGFTETLPGGAEAPAIVLFRQITFDAQEKTSKACVNMVVEVRDPANVPADLLAPYVWWSSGPVTTSTSFLLRDGKIERKGAGVLTNGRPTIGIHHVAYDFGDLQKGDVFGWSIISEQEGPPVEISVPMAERVPMVISNVTTRGNDKYAYRARWYGIQNSEVDLKEQEVKDRRPMGLRVSANQRAAVPTRSAEPPFRADEPHVVVSLEEVYVSAMMEGMKPGWVSASGWNQLASSLALVVDDQAGKFKAADIALGAVTTGKTTVHEKAAAICDFVREKFTLLEGPEFDDGARRDLAEVFKANEGTRSELIFLTAVLMKKAQVPVVITPLREPAYGAMDEQWGHVAQITDAALRVQSDDQVVYYAPQCKECAAGTLPESWTGARAVVSAANLAEIARAENDAMRKRAMAEGNFDPAGMQAEIAKKNWTRFETLRGTPKE